MTLDEFEHFLDSRKEFLKWGEEGENFVFSDDRYGFYQNGGVTSIPKTKMASMTPQELDKAIYGGLRVEHITRVTGYFAQVNSFNPGKRGELKDRHREAL